MKIPSIITLTSDFGLRDGYVASLKGVILSIAPQTNIVDFCHEIRPQDISHGAFVLHTTSKYFTDYSIHVGVVDPGVGSQRRAIAIKTEKAFYIGPDNGLFSLILNDNPINEIRSIENNSLFLNKISSTFHGRDIFAPVAAHIANGTPFESIGNIITNPVTLKYKSPIYNNELIVGHVLCIDHFGNIITNITRNIWEKVVMNRRFMIFCGKRLEKINNSYSETNPGEVLAIFNSSDYLEISINYGNAAKQLGLEIGSEIEIDLL